MRRIATYALTLLVTLAAVGGIIRPGVTAHDGTPEASPESVASAPPRVGAPIEDSGGICVRSEFPLGPSAISFEPLEDFGFAVPVDAPRHNLYLTVSTLPPHSCILFHGGTFGVATFFVLEGSMQVIIRGKTNDNLPVVTAGNEAGVTVTVPNDAPVTLGEGDWLTVDREAGYAYRNPSNEDARIVMAVYEDVAQQANGCASGCRRHP